MFWSLFRIVLGFYLIGSVAVLSRYGYHIISFILVAIKAARHRLRTTIQHQPDALSRVVCIDSHWRFGCSTTPAGKELLESHQQERRAW